MERDTIGALGFACVVLLIMLRVPVAIAMGVVGALGYGVVNGFSTLGFVIGRATFESVFPISLSVVPLFIMMGVFAAHGGLSRSLYTLVASFVGHWRGGLAMATIGASALFGAVCGSSIATAATIGRIAMPEMRSRNYDDRLASASVAAGGTLGIMIPPSIAFVIYGIFAEVSIVKLLLAGILPGILTAAVYMIMIMGRAWLDPKVAPPIVFEDRGALWRERWASLGEIWPILVLILGVIGGLYAGVVTPTEAGAAGALLATLIGMVQRKLSYDGFIDAMKDAMGTTAQLFFVGIGAVIYAKFLALAGTAEMFTQLIGSWALDPLLLVVAVSLIYIVLGTFLDPLGMILLTIPVFVPMFAALKLDLVWFGVLVVKYIGISLLTPPVGFNIYVVASATNNSIPLKTIYRGCYWFLGAEVVIMALLIAFPQISLWLPNSMQ